MPHRLREGMTSLVRGRRRSIRRCPHRLGCRHRLLGLAVVVSLVVRNRDRPGGQRPTGCPVGVCWPLRTARLRLAQVVVVVVPGVVLPAVVGTQQEVEPMVVSWNSLRCFVAPLQDLLGRRRRQSLLPGCPVMALLDVDSQSARSWSGRVPISAGVLHRIEVECRRLGTGQGCASGMGALKVDGVCKRGTIQLLRRVKLRTRPESWCVPGRF